MPAPTPRSPKAAPATWPVARAGAANALLDFDVNSVLVGVASSVAVPEPPEVTGQSVEHGSAEVKT